MTTPNLSQAPAPAPARAIADIEAELGSIDIAARELDLQDAAAQAPAQAASSTTSADESEARRKGWRPKAEYTGPTGKWVDATTFLERGERFTKNLEAKVEALQQQVNDFEGTKAMFRKFLDERLAERDREHAAAIRALKTQRLQAIREGDDDAALDIEARIETVQESQKTFKAEAAQMAADKAAASTPSAGDEAAAALSDPVLVEWMEDGNDWFRTDETLQKYAIDIGKQIRASGSKAVGREFLEQVEAQVRRDFPRKFRELSGQSPRLSPTSGAQSGAGAPSTESYNGKTERDLPAADLALMRQFVKEGLYTRAQFLQSYFSRNG